jgi:nucleotide-binding universal stress UspA family protein
LAAVDLSSFSEGVVRAAAVVARAAGLSELYILHVRGAPTSCAEDRLRRLVSSIQSLPLQTHLLVEESQTVGRAVVDTAARMAADLVVVGARGHNPSTSVLLGAEAEQILRESAVPVLVVKVSGTHAPLLSALLHDPLSVSAAGS